MKERYFSVLDGKVVYFGGIRDALKQGLDRPLFRKTKTGLIVEAKYKKCCKKDTP